MAMTLEMSHQTSLVFEFFVANMAFLSRLMRIDHVQENQMSSSKRLLANITLKLVFFTLVINKFGIGTDVQCRDTLDDQPIRLVKDVLKKYDLWLFRTENLNEKTDLFYTIGAFMIDVYNDAKRVFLSANSWPSRQISHQIAMRFKNNSSVSTQLNFQYTTPKNHGEFLDCILNMSDGGKSVPTSVVLQQETSKKHLN
ncbi:hypothetical protein Bhyg_03007 [Pseudolycoriella hygida]|uniref:Uncharacterized protein n=1 Tax=Pseudolycoriella hygida TaxID=35572 RepID=A0A9Q0S753_9DIPT|nr:hypothetical protein Bhyg_03007 [Pseudolycoriella hygida]